MRFILRLIIICLILYIPVWSQSTNMHFGINAGGSGGLGLDGAIYGLTGGSDYRKGRFLLASDAEYFRLCKKGASCGHEVVGKSIIAIYLTSHLAIQAGIRAARYDVHVFHKANVEFISGIRIGSDRIVTELNYRKDLKDANRQHVGELIVTGYAKHHVFFRFGATYSYFYTGLLPMSGTASSFAIGFYKNVGTK